MSDPAKSAREIEDVLASIRRLVSESHDAPDATKAEVPRPDVTRLVLTPSLRVADPDDPWAPVPSPGSDAPAEADAMAEDEDPTWGLEDRLSDWGEIEDSADEAVADAIAEQSAEPFVLSMQDHMSDLVPPVDFVVAPQNAEEFELETGDADWPDGSAGRAVRDLAQVRGHGGEPVSADVTGADDAGETSVAADVVPAMDHGTGTEADPHEAGEIIGNEAATSMTEDRTAQADDAVQGPGFKPVFSRRIDVHRPAVDQSDHADHAEQLDHAEDDHDDLTDEVEDLGEDPQPFTFPEAEDDLLDEETLRDIIAEVVREELQGALGQRITRNVRKMVRREIRLALAAEEFE